MTEANYGIVVNHGVKPEIDDVAEYKLERVIKDYVNNQYKFYTKANNNAVKEISVRDRGNYTYYVGIVITNHADKEFAKYNGFATHIESLVKEAVSVYLSPMRHVQGSSWGDYMI